MTREQLFESIGQIDEALIERSNRPARPVWAQWAAAAACVCVVAAVVLAARTGEGARQSRMLSGESAAAAQMPVPAPDRTDYANRVLPEKGTPPPEDAEHEWSSLTPGTDGYISPEPTPEPAPASAPAENGAFLGPGEEPRSAAPPMISFYDMGGGASDACYAIPEDGEVGCSIPLRGAMEEYGNGVLYRVCADLFSGGVPLAPDSPEAEEERERLAALGYTVAYETYFDGSAERHYFTLHLRYGQLTGFAADNGYGYMLFLYDERVPG